MPKVIPSSFILPSLSELSLSEPIRASQYEALNASSNLLFSTRGVLIPGKISRSSAPLWRVTNTAYTQAGLATSLDPDALQSWEGVCRGWRYVNNINPLRLTYMVYGEGCDVRFTARSLDPTNAFSSGFAIACLAEGWYLAQATFSLSQATLGGAGVTPKPIGIYLEARRRAAYGEGRIWGWCVRERVLGVGDASLLP